MGEYPAELAEALNRSRIRFAGRSLFPGRIVRERIESLGGAFNRQQIGMGNIGRILAPIRAGNCDPGNVSNIGHVRNQKRTGGDLSPPRFDVSSFPFVPHQAGSGRRED